MFGTKPVQRFRLVSGRSSTLGTVMAELAAIHGNRRLVTEPATGRELTYRQAAELVASWSAGIAQRISPGDRVVVAVPNGYDQFLMCLAVSRAGGLPVPVNAQMRASEIDHVEADSEAALRIRSVGDLAGLAEAIDAVAASPGDVGALFYTSGTTGSPKGAVLTHRALVGQLGVGAALPKVPIRESVAALPVAHIMGFITLLGMAMAGIPVVSFERFRAAEVLDAIEQRRSSLFVGVPAMYRMLLEAGAAERDLSSVRVWVSGADVMPPELARTFQGFGSMATLPLVGSVGGALFVEGYGMVEVGGGVAVKMLVPGVPTRGDALGFRLPGYHFRVVNQAGQGVRHGEVGELLLRGPGVLRGYWNAPEATAAVLDDDGWLHTGDLVRRGPAGTVIFQGRSKQVIKSGGYSVYPVEVAAALEQHPDVLEAAAVGMVDDKLGEVPVAAVRIRPGARVRPDQLVAFAADRLAHYKAPRQVMVVDDLPRTGTEKVQADRVRELFG
ncbi:MAG: AMP-binding protein [Microthrixaceae bacterium]|nr:AMP-binding protein [Microthrixaceae bacterium]